MKITIEVTQDEADMIRYAIQEMGNKRAEQAIDRNSKELRGEADQHYRLAVMVGRAAQPEAKP